MKKIPLPHGKFTLVDDEDFEYLSQWKWHSHERGYPRRTEYRNGKCFRYFRMSRVIMRVRPGEEVDHINRNPLDNRRKNLRVASTSQNQANRIILSNNTSGFKGVSWHKTSGKWSAYIGFQGKQYHLGVFSDIKDAARAYNTAAEGFYNEFAVLNKI